MKAWRDDRAGPGLVGLRRRVRERAAAPRAAGRARGGHGVDEEVDLAGLPDRRGKRLRVGRVGVQAGDAALAHGRQRLVAAGDGGDRPARLVQMGGDRAAEVARPEDDGRAHASAATRASSSSSTSPSSLQVARSSHGVGPMVTSTTSPPAAWVSSGQPGDRVHLERRADAEQDVGAGAERLRALDRVDRQPLAEEHDVGLQRRGAVLAARHAVGRRGHAPADLGEVRRGAAVQAGGRRDRPVDLHELPRARHAVQAVDVLRDDRVQDAALLELDEGEVRAVGLLAVERLEAVVVEGPEARGVAPPRVDVGDLHRVHVAPDPAAGRAEVRDPGRHRDAGAGQRDDRRPHPARDRRRVPSRPACR